MSAAAHPMGVPRPRSASALARDDPLLLVTNDPGCCSDHGLIWIEILDAPASDSGLVADPEQLPILSAPVNRLRWS